MPTTYISNLAHYTHVLEKVRTVRRVLWIGTADLKDLYVKDGLNNTIPFLSLLAERINRGVEVRLIHAKEPGPNFRQDFDKHPVLAKGLERALVDSAINQFDEVWMGKFCGYDLQNHHHALAYAEACAVIALKIL